MTEIEILGAEQLTRKEAVAWVMEAHGQAVQGIIETGRRLLELRAGRFHGTWLDLFPKTEEEKRDGQHLPFSQPTAFYLMEIANHPVLSNYQHIDNLPSSWGTLGQLARLPAAEIEAKIASGEINPTLERSTVQKWIVGAGGTTDDWYTPRWLFDQLGLRFDMDVCAPVLAAQRTCPAERYFTEQDNGLTQPWEGLVWCNPPWSDPAPWITRWATHDDGLLLTHFSVSSRRMPELWDAAHAIRLFAGMWFERPNGETHKPYWGVMLSARGPQSVEALRRVRNEWASPAWAPMR